MTCINYRLVGFHIEDISMGQHRKEGIKKLEFDLSIRITSKTKQNKKKNNKQKILDFNVRSIMPQLLNYSQPLFLDQQMEDLIINVIYISSILSAEQST